MKAASADLNTCLMQNALKLANAALEKHPDSALVKSLKSLALVRTGKLDEANKVSAPLLPLALHA